MALSAATITYDLSDYGLADFDSRRTKVWATNNVSGPVVDTEGNLIHLGSANGTVNADGTGSITVPTPGTGSNPASWQTTIHVDYPDRNANRGRGRLSLGPFTITVSANLADLVTQMEIPPETLGGDAWLATIDDDDSSLYRQQQDARLSATYAAFDGVRRTKTAGVDAALNFTEGYGFHLTASSSAAATGYRAVIGIGTDMGDMNGIFISQKAAGKAIDLSQQPGASNPGILAVGRSAQTALAQFQVHAANSGVMVQLRTGKGYAGATITAGSTTLTVPSGDFTAGDIGRTIQQVAYTGTATDLPGTIPSGTTITAVASATSVTLSQPAAFTATALQVFLVGRPGGTTQPIMRVYDENDVVVFGVRKSYIETALPVRSSAVGNIPLTVEGQTAQTASLLKIQREGDATARVEVTAAGLAVTRYGASINNAGDSTQKPLKITNYASTAVQALEIQQTVAAPAAGADVLRLTNDASNITSRFDRNGYFMTRKTTAPADADIGTGEMAVWFDSTNGAAKLMVKAKQADGTVRTGSVALA